MGIGKKERNFYNFVKYDFLMEIIDYILEPSEMVKRPCD
jgi:hypothetical protein